MVDRPIDDTAARLRRLSWWGIRALAVAYPLALLVVVAAFRLVGERWWATTVALYLPRLGFALPGPVLALALVIGGYYRWLATQLVAALIVVFPLMGLHLGRGVAPPPGSQVLRVVSFNVDEGRFGLANVIRAVRSVNPDLILLQEGGRADEDTLRAGFSDYLFRKDGQFAVASRYPIVDVLLPAAVTQNNEIHSLRFVRYRLQTGAGLVDVFNMHPLSPRAALDELHGEGLRQEILSGRILTPSSAPVPINANLRTRQVQGVADEARRSTYPVIIAGDTNLPEQSWAFAQWLGTYQDGFAQRGAGFGYTFPAIKRPWMRIDRILAGPDLRFLTCAVLTERASDHLAVTADLQLPSLPVSPP
ncbi:MAG TPA: endonuclease/exonuclease/phosphatase family protein [Polyangia bacterium]|jgi:endonuclease/exonuclease/phosphatase family metal-dependent hydrolase|nr:endonuclease/exonuclease/phosphatase family protein [Polyangia bacterium]